jgi:hypothetical protein
LVAIKDFIKKKKYIKAFEQTFSFQVRVRHKT